MIPFYLAGGIGVGFWMGGWIDRRLDTEPYLRVILMMLGAFAGMRETWRIIRRISKSEDARSK